jgi:flavine halogenase
VIRSEADEMIFRHAGKSGAKIFDGVKVNSVDFVSTNGTANGTANGTVNGALLDPGRPVSASYTKKADGTTGVIKFDYIVDASGRAGLLNTKYLKNRHYNKALKNVANWAYFKGAGLYGEGTKRANAPFFEALRGMLVFCYVFPLPLLSLCLHR